MSLTFTLTFRWPTSSGTLVDADTTPTFALTRVDTGASITADQFSHVSTGIYTWTINDPQSGVLYRATWSATVAGETISGEFDKSLTATTGSYLTTLANVKLYAGETGTSNDVKYTNALAAASAFIQRWCDQDFLPSSYTEYHDGPHDALRLYNCPITSVTRIATGARTVLTIQNTSTSAGRATISTSATGLTLSSTASGTTTNTTLAYATYPTLSQLATQISATSGWTASVDAILGKMNSTDLPYPITVSAAYLDGPAELEVYADELAATRIDYEGGIIYGCFPNGPRSIEVKYSAGSATVPDPVQQACAALATALYRRSNSDPTLQSEKIEDYSYTNAQQVAGVFMSDLHRFCPDAALLLEPYRRGGIA